MQESLYPQGSGLSHINQQSRKCPIDEPIGQCDVMNSDKYFISKIITLTEKTRNL